MLFYPFMVYPPAPADYDIPPTIYALLESIVNFNTDDKKKIKELAKYGRSTIFDFDYPLSDSINREDFECMILNHFLMRRIGYETLTAFKIALNVKLNEIMPMYNKMFDALNEWSILNDGETTTRTINDTATNSTATHNISDRRYSDTPQDRLNDIQAGTYMTDYNYDQDNGTVNSSSTGNTLETVNKTPSDRVETFTKFKELKGIYTMIFKDLDTLFYQL